MKYLNLLKNPDYISNIFDLLRGLGLLCNIKERDPIKIIF